MESIYFLTTNLKKKNNLTNSVAKRKSLEIDTDANSPKTNLAGRLYRERYRKFA
jgi:hypothetical protein